MDYKKLFGLNQDSQIRLGSLFKNLDELLQDYSEAEKKYITGLAGLLGSVAYSDREFSAEELNKASAILAQQSSLNQDEITTVMSVLKTLTEELAGIEDYRYTRMINDVADKKQKMEILVCLFSVAAADQSVNAEEEQRIGIITENLQLHRRDFIEARLKFKEFLDVLKL